MNEGLKRHMQYVSWYQSKIFAITILCGFVYAVFLTSTSHTTLKEISQYTEMVLSIIPCSIFVNYIRYRIDFCLSMGCTRRNIYLSIHILTAELLAESLLCYLLLQVITSSPINAGKLLSFVTTALLSAILGVLFGLLIRRFGYAKMMIILIIFYAGLAILTMNFYFLMEEFLSANFLLMVIGGILILYGLIVTLFGKRTIAGM